MFVHQGQCLDAVGCLQSGVFVKLVEDFEGLGIAFEFNDDGKPMSSRFVAQVRDVGDDILVDEFSKSFDEAGFVDLVGEFGDVDALAVLQDLVADRA